MDFENDDFDLFEPEESSFVQKIAFMSMIIFTIIAGAAYTYYSLFIGVDKELTIYESQPVSFLNMELTDSSFNFSYKNKEINNLYLLRYKIENSGEKKLEVSDYDAPITISSDWEKVIAVSYSDLNQIEENRFNNNGVIELPKIPLDKGFSYDVFVLVEGKPTEISVVGSVNGGERILITTDSEKTEKLENNMLKGFMILWGIVLLLMIVTIRNTFLSKKIAIYEWQIEEYKNKIKNSNKIAESDKE